MLEWVFGCVRALVQGRHASLDFVDGQIVEQVSSS